MKTMLIGAFVLDMLGHSLTENKYLLENTYTKERFEYITPDTLPVRDTVLVKIEVDCSRQNYNK